MVDLSRLKIQEGSRTSHYLGKGVWIAVILIALLFFVLGHYVPVAFPWDAKIVSVKTMVARKAQPDAVASFTAGGWIEVASPAYPKKIVSHVMDERIDEILVKEGDEVRGGQVVARLYNQYKKHAWEKAKAVLAYAEEDLRRMQNGFRPEEIAEAIAEVGDIEEQLAIAKINLSRSEKLGAEIVSESTLDQERAEVSILSARLERAKATALLRTNGYRQEEIEMARAKVAEAKADCDQAALDYALCEIKIPAQYDGLRVLKVLAKEGQMTSSEDQMGHILLLYNPAEMQVRADIRQQNIKQIRIGGPVVVKTETDLFHEYRGTVLRIDPEADIAKNTVSVKIRIENPDEFLFPEMVAQITFIEKEAPSEESDEYFEVMLLPASSVYYADDGSPYVWINRNGHASKQTIKLAKNMGKTIEVAEGLEGGMRVIISDVTKLKEGMQITEE